MVQTVESDMTQADKLQKEQKPKVNSKSIKYISCLLDKLMKER